MFRFLFILSIVATSFSSAFALDVKSCHAEGRVNGEAFSFSPEDFKIKNEKPWAKSEDYHFTFVNAYKKLSNNNAVSFFVNVNHAVDRVTVVTIIDDAKDRPEGSNCNPKFCKALEIEMGGKAGPANVKSDLITAKGENANFRLSCDVIADQVNLVEQNLDK